MASTSTTTAKIPTELKPLFEQSVRRMLALQGYYWGPTIPLSQNQWRPPSYGGGGGDGGGGGGDGGDNIRIPDTNKLPAPRQPRRTVPRNPGTGGGGGGEGPAPPPPDNPNPNTTAWATGTTPIVNQTENDNDNLNDPSRDDPLLDRTAYQGLINQLFSYNQNNLPLPLQWMPRGIADINANEPAWEAYRTALGMGSLTGSELAALNPAYEAAALSSKQVTGDTLQNNPVIEAQWNAFKTNLMPEIQNQMALAGLGRSSSAANAVAKAWAGMLPQLYENQLGREERSIERSMQGRRDLADFLVNALGRREFERQQARTDRLWDMGKWYQDYLQSKEDARYQELMRHAGMAENALFQPFGGFLPSTIGSKTRSK